MHLVRQRAYGKEQGLTFRIRVLETRTLAPFGNPCHMARSHTSQSYLSPLLALGKCNLRHQSDLPCVPVLHGLSQRLTYR